MSERFLADLPDLLPDELPFVCKKVSGETHVESFDAWGHRARREMIDAEFAQHAWD